MLGAISAIYIAGPMDGVPNHNFPLFNRVAANLRRQGFVVFTPTENGCAPDSPYLTHIDADIDMIQKCNAMLMLPGWHRSRGAQAEMEIAKWRNMTILFSDAHPEVLK